MEGRKEGGWYGAPLHNIMRARREKRREEGGGDVEEVEAMGKEEDDEGVEGNSEYKCVT